jgi:pimeloyl-ACP methyl ester carboxylesterase
MLSTPTIADLSQAQTWIWRGLPISYQSCGDAGPAIVMVHGFGASWGHWRKNITELGKSFRCYAIDLLGFGDSAKPTPSTEINYTFETWGQQLADFCREIVGSPAFLVGNSIGCIVVMQAAVDYPEIALGIANLNCSLRLLHDRKRTQLPWYRNLGATVIQSLLNYRWVGSYFFNQLAKPKVIRKILLQAYGNQAAVTDELIQMLLKPAQDPGAVDVFVAFTRYSQGPLPEDLLPQLSCPTILLWGTNDPWEDVDLGRKLADFSTVEKFIELEGLGHCPQDENPEVVNSILQEWFFEVSQRNQV